MANWKDVWSSLLNNERLGEGRRDQERTPHRSAFDRDYDRIIFSSAFRRLQDKTQVFPLSRSDYTRTRLTHSLEVASVGRSLGKMAAKNLMRCGKFDDVGVTPDEVGTLVSAACLAHDVGNPPFGHSGEKSIQEWARGKLSGVDLTDEERLDFEYFEGNAQTFRAYAKLQGRERRGGLRLTYATLGTIMKYPVGSESATMPTPKPAAYKKFGFYQDDKVLAEEVFEHLNLVKSDGTYKRHPLVYLMEAADDICYAVIDLEDAYRLKVVPFEEVFGLLRAIAEPKNLEGYSLSGKIIVARAKVINELAEACSEVFTDNFDSIVDGTFEGSLIERARHSEEYEALKSEARKKVYTDERVLQIEYAGFRAIGGLLDMLFPALMNDTRSAKDEKLLTLFPKEYLNLSGGPQEVDNRESLEKLTSYQRVLVATDYISGMTDGFAVDLFQKLSGVKLPT